MKDLNKGLAEGVADVEDAIITDILERVSTGEPMHNPLETFLVDTIVNQPLLHWKAAVASFPDDRHYDMYVIELLDYGIMIPLHADIIFFCVGQRSLPLTMDNQFRLTKYRDRIKQAIARSVCRLGL